MPKYLRWQNSLAAKRTSVAMLAMVMTLSLLWSGVPLLGATYYIDFDGGNNSNAGTSTGAAWKHCPGDPNATGTPASTALAAGDTVFFKGGVVYRGSVTMNWSGNDRNPVTYDGNLAGTWGTGRAIMDGTIVVSTAWERCTDSIDAGGNPNFANIYWTPIPSGVSNGWPQLLYNGTNQTHTAQHPNPSDRFLWDDTTEWRSVAHTLVSSSTLTDATYFNQSSAAYWHEAWIGMRGAGNSMNFRRIASFNPSTATVSFPIFANYTDRNTEYAVFNHPSLIDQPGEHAVSTNRNRLYLWPPGSVHPTNYTWSVASRSIGFYAQSKNNLRVLGFAFRGYYVGFDAGNEGGAAVVTLNTSTPGDGSARNNTCNHTDIRFMKSMIRRSLITLNNDSGVQANNNTMAFSFASGIRMATGILTANSNRIDHLTGTGIFFQGARNSIIKGNNISNLIGTHANGISVYTSSRDVEVSYNRIYNVGSLMTFEYSTNLNVLCNLVDAAGKDQRINEWGGMGGIVQWLGNTLVNNSANRILNLGATSTASYVIKNNIIDGGGAHPSTRSHNIYTGRNWWQESQYGWSFAPNETVQTEADLFVLPRNDWSLKAGSPAIDTGTADLSTAISVDINGNLRPRNLGMDIGAFEFEEIYRPEAPESLRIVP